MSYEIVSISVGSLSSSALLGDASGGDSYDLHSILNEGYIDYQGIRRVAIPREVIVQDNEVKTVIFETISLEKFKKPMFLKVFFQAIRFDSLIRILAPTIVIFLYGLNRNWLFDKNLGILACSGAACLQLSAHLLNDVSDYLHLKDLPNSLSGRGVLQKGWATSKQLKYLGCFFLILGVVLGLPAVLKAPQSLFLLGGGAGVGVFIYTIFSNLQTYSKLNSLKSILREFVFFLLQGPLLVLGISISFFGQWDLGVLFLGSFFGFLSWSVLHAQHVQELAFSHDQNFNKIRGITNSLAVAFGFQKARNFLSFLYLASFVCVLIASAFSFWPFWVGACLLVSEAKLVIWLINLYRASGPHSSRVSCLKKEAFHFYWRFGIWMAVAWGIELISLKMIPLAQIF